MCTARCAIRKRRQAHKDPRYRQKHKDPAKLAARGKRAAANLARIGRG